MSAPDPRCARARGLWECHGLIAEAVALLRSDAPLTHECRRWLADLLEHQLHGAGRPPKEPHARDRDRLRKQGVKLRVAEAKRNGEKLAAVRLELAELWGVSESRIKADEKD